MNLLVQSAADENEVVLFVEGEVDAFTAPQLKEKLLELIQHSTYPTVSLDVGNVTYMDSTGVGVLIGAMKSCKQSDRKLVIRNVPPRIERLFKITGLIELISVEPLKGVSE